MAIHRRRFAHDPSRELREGLLNSPLTNQGNGDEPEGIASEEAWAYPLRYHEIEKPNAPGSFLVKKSVGFQSRPSTRSGNSAERNRLRHSGRTARFRPRRLNRAGKHESNARPEKDHSPRMASSSICPSGAIGRLGILLSPGTEQPGHYNGSGEAFYPCRTRRRSCRCDERVGDGQPMATVTSRSGLKAERLLALYRLMQTIRRCEEHLARAHQRGAPCMGPATPMSAKRRSPSASGTSGPTTSSSARTAATATRWPRECRRRRGPPS